VPAYPLHRLIVWRNLDLPSGGSKNLLQALGRNFRKIRHLRRAIRQSQPDLIISFLDIPNIVTLLATRWLRIPVIVSEHSNPGKAKMHPVWLAMRRLIYPFADALVCPTSSILESLQKKINIPGQAIPNPVTIPSPKAKNLPHSEVLNTYVVTAMGRLVPEKGFDMLLEAFSRIAAIHPDWSLRIIGDGPLYSQLTAQTRALGLNNRVVFTGPLADPFPVLYAGDLFVFSSRFEGFGLALMEAMACGLPVISFNCPAGPAEIIRHEIDGLLVPPEDVNALATAMARLMASPQERERLASRAPEVLTRFSMKSVLARWEELFRTLKWPHKKGSELHAGKRDRD